MLRAKRGGGVLTRSMRKTEWISGRLPVDSTQDAWAGLCDGIKSYLSKTVASITLCHGSTILFSCSGIAMEHKMSICRFLTSASLVEALNGAKRDDDDVPIKIEVRHEGYGACFGRLDEYDLLHNFAVVSVSAFFDIKVGPFQRALENLPHGEVLIAVARSSSGEIMAKSVELNGDLGVYGDDDDLDQKTKEAWEGGPVLFADHIVGMNLFLTKRRAIFKPFSAILKHLECCWTSQQMKAVFRCGEKPMGDKSITYPHTVGGYYFKKDLLDLDNDGYPKLPPTMLGNDMILVNTFEEIFGDILVKGGEGVWSKFGKRDSNIDRNVVALASFSGEKRFFACSGFFIKWNECTTILTSASLVRNSGDENKIDENLRIEVKLRHGQCREGTLQHYNLHYNVALVSINGYRAGRPLNPEFGADDSEVAAVGRCFSSGALMAMSGERVYWSGTLDCRSLMRSTCKITKAGIGGPLVNLDGDVLGMNFYDTRIGTPYLSWENNCRILSWFDTKSKPREVGNGSDSCGLRRWKEAVRDDDKTVLNRWPVPMPLWRCPDFVDEDKSDDEEDESDGDSISSPRYGGKSKFFRKKEYTYELGIKLYLC